MRGYSLISISRLSLSLVLGLALTLSACGGAATDDGTTTTAGADQTTTTAGADQTTTTAEADQTTTTAEEMEPLTIQFTWLPTPGFAPVFLAEERGYFAEEGLDVTINPGGGAVGAPQQLAAGNADIAVGGVDDVPNARAEGIPLASLAVIERYATMAVMVRETSDVTEPEDLAGETITVRNFDVTGNLLPAYLTAIGVDPESVTINNVDPQAQVPLFVSGEIDIGTGFIRDEILKVQTAGVPVRIFPYFDAGIRFPGAGIFTTQDILQEKPDVVRRAVRAILRGFADAVDDPEASIAAAAERYPEQYENIEQAEGDAELFAESIRTHMPDEGLGYQRLEDWQDAVDLLTEYMGLEDPLPASEYFTNDFLPEEGISLD